MQEISKSEKSQRGFLMPLAIFILVAMSFFAITISRVSGQSGIATTQEAISSATFHAAESGAQYSMSELFFDSGSAISRASVDGNCTAVNGDTLTFSVGGLNGCSATINCTQTTDAANTTSFYRIQSQANCGSGAISALRTVEISAYMK